MRGLLAAARRTGCRTHIVHLSAAAALPDIARAAEADGLPVTVETCPHYLALAAEQVPDGATQFKCCPPVRGAENREQLWQALADGLIDCVVSDHSPCPVADKMLDTGRFRGGLGRDRLAAAQPAGDLDRGGGPGALAGAGRALDGGGARAAGRPARPRRDPAGRAGRFLRARAGRGVHRGSGPAGAAPPADAVRGTDAARRGPPDVAARRAGLVGRGGWSRPEERGSMARDSGPPVRIPAAVRPARIPAGRLGTSGFCPTWPAGSSAAA